MLLLREEGREDIGLPASVARLAVGDTAQAVGEGCAGFDEGVASGGDAADRADEVDAEVGGCRHVGSWLWANVGILRRQEI